MARSDCCVAQSKEHTPPSSKRSPKATNLPPPPEKTAPTSSRGCGASEDPVSVRRAPASKRKTVTPPAPEATPLQQENTEEGAILYTRFKQVISQISTHLQQGNYVAEHCAMLLEIVKISTSPNCPTELRKQAEEMMLKLARRSPGDLPCRRGVQEMVKQCFNRGIYR